MAMSCCKKLPEELKIEILSRLPVKSLLRSKTVCKSWYVLIKSPGFIHKHLHLSRTSSSRYLLVLHCQDDPTQDDAFRYFATILSSETLGVSREVSREAGLPKASHSLIVGSCNGLVCITDYDTIDIYNPATRQIKSLSIPPSITGQPQAMFQTSFWGFGFDPKMNDYKVVRIVSLSTVRDLPSVVQICMLRSGSWKETELVLPKIYDLSFFYYNWLNTYINGTFNWLARGFEKNEFMILSFHMSDEEFKTIKIPDFLMKDHDGFLALWNGSFALIRTPSMRGLEAIGVQSTQTYFDIWAVNQSRHEEAWVKKVTVRLGRVHRPLAILGIDTLFLESSKGKLISCDLQTKEIRKHQIKGIINSMQVGIYNESLTSVE